MTPVTNKPPMPQAPGKGISSFPTPVIDDVVITEIVNAWKGNYTPLEYGVMWDDVTHASMQGSHPDHKLVYQEPASQEGEWIKRIWVNDRVNQDSYNYAIKYSGGSQAHPIYTRTYVLPREGYVPLPDLTPDETYPTALLVEEEVQRNEGELDSKYIKVVRVFETLQGPEITSYRYNERGDIETVTNQQVSPETPPDPDGLFVTQSQVIKQDVSKGTKTTATVESYATLSSKEKKAGLLGETITTDDIVAPSTVPDALSQTIVSSSVEQISATKARKRTTTSTGPTSLSQKSKDGKLLGNVTVTESVVAPSTNPDEPTGTTSGILSSEIKQIDSGKAIKTNTVLNSTPTLSGSKKSSGLLGKTTTSETVVAAGTLADDLTLNILSSQVESIDSQRSRKVTETSTGPTTLSTNSLVDSPVGLVKATVNESIVSPTFTGENGLNILSDKIDSIDEAKSKRNQVQLNQNWPTNTGIEYDEQLGVGMYYTETVVGPDTYISSPPIEFSNVNYRPLDHFKSLQKKYDRDKIGESLLTQYFQFETQTQVSLPDQLMSATAIFGLSNGQGSGSGSGSGSGDSYSWNYNASKTSSGSASGDLSFMIRKGFSGFIPSKEHTFFLKINNDGTLNGSILTSLNAISGNTYLNWPIIRKFTQNIVLIGGSTNQTTNTSGSASVSLNGSSNASSNNESYSVNVSANSVSIPDTLHGPITINKQTIGNLSGITVTYDVFPSSIPATSPASFPTGEYLLSSDISLYKYGFVKVVATTVNITSQYV